MDPDLVELNRCRGEQGVADTIEPLKAAGIKYKVGSTAISFDISKIGTGDDPEVIISVRKEDYDAARAVLEEEYSKFELPEGHYLLSSSDEEIAEILADPSGWNAFDVVHARRLAEERDIEPEKILQKKAERIEALKEGKPAPLMLLIFGWIFSGLGLFGGILGMGGIGVALSLCLMREDTPDGKFPTYNNSARQQGAWMLCLTFLVMGIAAIKLSLY